MSGKPDAEKIWTSALNLLRSMLNPDIFNLWFSPIRAVEVSGGALLLEVPNDFCELWLKDNYHGLICDVLGSVSGQRMEVKFRPTNAPAAEALASRRPEPKIEAVREVAEQSDRFNGKELPFNPKNTFDTFVVGSNNSFAHAAAIAVAKEPG